MTDSYLRHKGKTMPTDDADVISSLVAEISAVLEMREASVAQGIVALGITIARLIHSVGEMNGEDAHDDAHSLAASAIKFALADIKRQGKHNIAGHC